MNYHGKKIHPLVTSAQEQLRQGKISRRDFLKFSTLLGASLATAQFLALCGSPEETAAPAKPTGVPPTMAPEPTASVGIQRGGTLTCATRVERVDHSSESRNHAAGQQTSTIQRQIIRHLDDLALVYDDVFRKRRRFDTDRFASARRRPSCAACPHYQ